MPRQRIHHSRETYEFPDDFPERLKRFHRESGLPWAELNRRLGTHPYTMRRWVKGLARPSTRHMMALLDLAKGPGPRPPVHKEYVIVSRNDHLRVGGLALVMRRSTV